MTACLSSCHSSGNNNPRDYDEFVAYAAQNNALFNAGAIPSYTDLLAKVSEFENSRKNLSLRCRAAIFMARSSIYRELQKPDSCYIYLDSAIYLFETKGLTEKFPSDYIDMLYTKGTNLYATGNYDLAYSCYFRAKQLAEQSNDTCATPGYDYGLGMIAYQQKKYREAAAYFTATYRAIRNCPNQDLYQLQEELDNIGLCYEKLNIPDSALFYYDSARSFVIHNPKIFDTALTKQKPLAVIYGNMGGVLLATGKTDSAIALLKKSYLTNIQWRFDNRDAVLTHLKLARAYLQKNDLEQLKTSLVVVRQEMDSIPHPLTAESSWRKLMSEYYQKTGNETEAFRYYREYAALADSLWGKEKLQILNDLDLRLKDKEQLAKIDLLQKQNQLNNSYLVATVGFSSLAIVIVALVYINYKRSKKNVRELKLLNNQVNEQKQQLELTAGELRASNADKDRILHVVAHDLRNQVGAIMMLAKIVEEESGPTQKESIEMIIGASQSALTLISELLEFSNDAKPGASYSKEPVDARDLVKHTADLLQFKAGEKNQHIEVSLPDGPLMVSANRDKLNRVLGNIITNAVKFSPSNETIRVATGIHGHYARIAIKDNGIGIPEKIRPHIFDPFTRAKRYGTAGEKSFGLGLSICKQIVEAHGGRIWVESVEGAGSTFFIELPLLQA